MLSMMVMSCQEAPRPGAWSDADMVVEPPTPEYLALVSVTLTDDPAGALESSGRGDAHVASLGTFVEYAGGNEQHVRMLSGIPQRAAQRFSPGTCVRVDSLTRPFTSNDLVATPTEVMLLDVGNIYLEANEHKLPFDLVLVPDLPPVFAGVSYRQRETSLSVGTPSPDGSFMGLIHIDALSDSDLNAIFEPVVFPPAIALSVELDEEQNTLHAQWEGASPDPMEFEIQFIDSDGGHLSVVCVIEDRSMLTLPLRDLEGLNLPSSLPVHVTARRFTSSIRASGVFEEIEFQGIRASQVSLDPSLP